MVNVTRGNPRHTGKQAPRLESDQRPSPEGPVRSQDPISVSRDLVPGSSRVEQSGPLTPVLKIDPLLKIDTHRVRTSYRLSLHGRVRRVGRTYGNRPDTSACTHTNECSTHIHTDTHTSPHTYTHTTHRHTQKSHTYTSPGLTPPPHVPKGPNLPSVQIDEPVIQPTLTSLFLPPTSVGESFRSSRRTVFSDLGAESGDGSTEVGLKSVTDNSPRPPVLWVPFLHSDTPTSCPVVSGTERGLVVQFGLSGPLVSCAPRVLLSFRGVGDGGTPS